MHRNHCLLLRERSLNRPRAYQLECERCRRAPVWCGGAVGDWPCGSNCLLKSRSDLPVERSSLRCSPFGSWGRPQRSKLRSTGGRHGGEGLYRGSLIAAMAASAGDWCGLMLFCGPANSRQRPELNGRACVPRSWTERLTRKPSFPRNRESMDPHAVEPRSPWIPAFAGMTVAGMSAALGERPVGPLGLRPTVARRPSAPPGCGRARRAWTGCWRRGS